jgi:hypothetical protein
MTRSRFALPLLRLMAVLAGMVIAVGAVDGRTKGAADLGTEPSSCTHTFGGENQFEEAAESGGQECEEGGQSGASLHDQDEATLLGEQDTAVADDGFQYQNDFPCAGDGDLGDESDAASDDFRCSTEDDLGSSDISSNSEAEEDADDEDDQNDNFSDAEPGNEFIEDAATTAGDAAEPDDACDSDDDGYAEPQMREGYWKGFEERVQAEQRAEAPLLAPREMPPASSEVAAPGCTRGPAPMEFAEVAASQESTDPGCDAASSDLGYACPESDADQQSADPDETASSFAADTFDPADEGPSLSEEDYSADEEFPADDGGMSHDGDLYGDTSSDKKSGSMGTSEQEADETSADETSADDEYFEYSDPGGSERSEGYDSEAGYRMSDEYEDPLEQPFDEAAACQAEEENPQEDSQCRCDEWTGRVEASDNSVAAGTQGGNHPTDGERLFRAVASWAIWPLSGLDGAFRSIAQRVSRAEWIAWKGGALRPRAASRGNSTSDRLEF